MARLQEGPVFESKSGWRVVRFSNDGLADPDDGHDTAPYDYMVYGPGDEVAREVFGCQRDAVRFAKARSK